VPAFLLGPERQCYSAGPAYGWRSQEEGGQWEERRRISTSDEGTENDSDSDAEKEGGGKEGIVNSDIQQGALLANQACSVVMAGGAVQDGSSLATEWVEPSVEESEAPAAASLHRIAARKFFTVSVPPEAGATASFRTFVGSSSRFPFRGPGGARVQGFNSARPQRPSDGPDGCADFHGGGGGPPVQGVFIDLTTDSNE
jgi:hypothetical protein